MKIEANGIQLEYESFGNSDDHTVLLIMGLGEQLTAWHREFCEALVTENFHVVRFDNRDVGLSEKFDEAGVPDVISAMMTGRAPDAPYTLDDMAADGIGLLDALGIDAAHVAGASMGGMIAQTMAINHADRLRSLTSIMSTTGNPEVSQGKPEAMQVLVTPPPDPSDPEAVIEHKLHVWETVGSPGYPTPREQRAAWIRRDYERNYHPMGVPRQLAAIIAHGDRRRDLRKIDVPTVVLHGEADPLIPVEAGEDTARVIPHAELRVIEGMGHDFPLALVDDFVAAILAAGRR